MLKCSLCFSQREVCLTLQKKSEKRARSISVKLNGGKCCSAHDRLTKYYAEGCVVGNKGACAHSGSMGMLAW